MHPRHWFAIAALMGCCGIALGALGAHGLPKWLAVMGMDEATVGDRLTLFETAVRYQMYAALALCGLALAADRWPARGWALACGMMTAGAIVFCGALYGLVLAEGSARPVLGMTAPFGGSLMIAAWAVAAWRAWRG